MTMTVIQHIELGSAAASIDFNSIPTDGTDLYCLFSIRTNDSSANFVDVVIAQFNGSTTGYSFRELYGTGSTTASGSGSAFFAGYGTDPANTSNTFASSALYIPNYRSSVAKSGSAEAVSESNNTTSYQVLFASLWTGTDPISSLSLKPYFGTQFVAGSSATLYKITKGSDGTTTVS